ncbi:uncharacterized protein LOC130630515 isoform X2 [Hydractinia symbiolongicarpus]|uniref:uncharacterized protein LOC130630515 isoform X2 n=1 Tax=Hydractinia symbiolongicarpus TaxID=13093 RepID=UPI002549E2DB|nr:uncharacterized protein LOC130630515 isoform X2 [Hydractinia symbiolongicarpus]
MEGRKSLCRNTPTIQKYSSHEFDNLKDAVRKKSPCNVLVGVIEKIMALKNVLVIKVADGTCEAFVRVQEYCDKLSKYISSGDILYLKKITFDEDKMGEFAKKSLISKHSNMVLPYPEHWKKMFYFEHLEALHSFIYCNYNIVKNTSDNDESEWSIFSFSEKDPEFIITIASDEAPAHMEEMNSMQKDNLVQIQEEESTSEYEPSSLDSESEKEREDQHLIMYHKAKKRKQSDVNKNTATNRKNGKKESGKMETSDSEEDIFSQRKTKKLRQAEQAAEYQPQDIICKKREFQHRLKKRNAPLRKVKTELQLKKQRKKVEELVSQHLGSADAITQHYHGLQKKYYIYKCSVCGAFVSEKLRRHLQEKHKYSWSDARLQETKMRVFFLWCNATKHETHLPLPCMECSEWHTRLDHHLKRHPFHKQMSMEEIKETVEQARAEHWSKGFGQNGSKVPSEDKVTEKFKSNLNVEADGDDFVSRSQPVPLQHDHPSLDYIPSGSCRLTSSKRKEWGVKPDDFFSIYFSTADDLLDNFQEELLQSGHTKDNSTQHRNQVELIWTSISKDLVMFPINPLSNMHLLRDYYHRPTFKTIGKKDGVQASTLRARYGSLGMFLQYLRRNEIFAGMSRLQLSSLSQSANDFNKQLNPLVKQRKVEIRKNKCKQLLRPTHFIKYGESKFVQHLISQVQKGVTKRSQFTRSFAIQFRDYLITNLVIGNGLRASNIIELTTKDVDNATVVEGYEGHKVLSNYKYKTSTIYGEKFIVVNDMLYLQLQFFLRNLRSIISKNPSLKVFLPASGAPKMSQTNVSASLTASFKLAKVLFQNEYQRISCTRVRCGLATFACNDGGFESGFFAKHFMKNKEQTTDMHYNLLSNRRHALNIAMKLYASFNGVDGEKITIEPKDVHEIADKLKKSSGNLNKEQILRWLKSNDPHVTKSELADFEEMLAECDQKPSGNTSSFYGASQQEKDIDFISVANLDGTTTENEKLSSERSSEDGDSDSENESFVNSHDGSLEEQWTDKNVKNISKKVSTRTKVEITSDSSGSDIDCDHLQSDIQDVLFQYDQRRPGDLIYARQSGGRIAYLMCAHFCEPLIIRKPFDNEFSVETFKDEEVAYFISKIKSSILRKHLEMFTPTSVKFFVLALRRKYWSNVKLNFTKWKRFRKEGSSMIQMCKDYNDFSVTSPEQRNKDNDLHHTSQTSDYKEESSSANQDLSQKDNAKSAVCVKQTKNYELRKATVYVPPTVCDTPSFMHDPNEVKQQNPKASEEQALGDEQCCLTNVDPSSNFICKKIDSYIGHGVFALKKFIPGDFLLQYPGSLVTAEKGDKLEKYYEKKGKGCYLYFFNYHGKKLCVDATKNNRLGKFVNDSQKSYANSVMKVKTFGGKPFLCLYALKTIEKGSEIRYSYGETSGLTWRKMANYKRPFSLTTLGKMDESVDANLELSPDRELDLG